MQGTSLHSFNKFGQVVKEEKLFKEIDDTLMDDIIGNHKSLS
jgi:hypothetical protein